MVTTFGRPGYLRRALEAGASGFVVKDTPARRARRRGATRARRTARVDPSLATESLVGGPNPLTPREREVLRESLSGAPVAAIAAHVHLSAGTVRNYLVLRDRQDRHAAPAPRRRATAEDRGWL